MEPLSQRKANTSRFMSAPRTQRTYVHKYPSRTLADDNLKGYEASKANSFIQDEITEPQRIELPIYFNTPRRFAIQKAHLPDPRVSVTRRLVSPPGNVSLAPPGHTTSIRSNAAAFPSPKCAGIIELER